MAPKKSQKRESEASLLMWDHLKELGAGEGSIRREFAFCRGRKWRFDFAVITAYHAIGIEIEGGAFIQGRHTRGVGFINDMDKYNHAALYDWAVLRFTPSQVLDGTAIAFIKRVLES